MVVNTLENVEFYAELIDDQTSEKSNHDYDSHIPCEPKNIAQ